MTATISLAILESSSPLVKTETKKKCTGKCGNCQKDRQLNEQSKIQTVNKSTNDPIGRSEMHGVEFELGRHKRYWSGCFKGTREF